MATKSQTLNPVSRLSRIGLALGLSSEPEKAEDWYIPYNGPYEPAKSPTNSDWSSIRRRAPSVSSVSTVAHRKNSSAVMPGGIGDTPQRAPVPKRASLASFLSFGPSSRRPSTSNGVHQAPSTSSRRSVSSQQPLFYSDNLSIERPRQVNRSATTQPTASTSQAPASIPHHPYATTYAVPHPLPPSKVKDHVTFNSKNLDVPAHLKPSSRASLLKASASSPDLRSLSAKGKHHWLSAETWCDAIIFPRPRFTIKHIADGKERIISPPLTPLLAGTSPNRDRDKSLGKSKSVTDLRTSNFANVVPMRVVRDQNSRSLRPQSFAYDDLAVPSPVPSLATVLVAGQSLQDERQAWQRQASRSIGNKRSRSLSRSRSKSQSNSKPWQNQPDEGAFDFLAARTLLGNQTRAPVVNIDSQVLSGSQVQTGSGLGTFSFGSGSQSRSRSKSHAHSNSLGTFSDNQNHKHTGSFGTALRKARTTATAAFAGSDDRHEPATRGISQLEEALNNTGDTKVINLSEWTNIPGPHGRSPTPSGEGVGIAISTPPPDDGVYGGPIRMPAHPYAQGSAYAYAQPTIQTRPDPDSPHRQPVLHPYAPHGGHLTPDNPISPARRMFAQIPSGQIREIQADEIQYSPFVMNGPGLPSPVRNGSFRSSGRSSDLLNMGEALNSTMRSHRGSPDSGIGASEDQSHHPFGPAPIPQPRSQPKRVSPSPGPEPKRVSPSPRPVNPPKLEFPNEDPTILFPLPRKMSKSRPAVVKESSDPASNHTLASSASGGNAFGVDDFLAPRRMLSDSTDSGSSPAGKSHESSPPGSIRPIGRLDDYESFHDLFYKPKVTTPSTEVPDEGNSRLRTVSGFTSLTRQLSIELHEDRDGHSDDDSGHRRPKPKLPLKMPDVPEQFNEQDSPVDLRMGSITAVTTPSPMRSPHRASTSAHITLFDEDEHERVTSLSSSLSPIGTHLTRSSYMTTGTDTSRMSGLSDFPVPPADLTPAHTSIIASYFGNLTPHLPESKEQEGDEYPFSSNAADQPRPRPTMEERNESFRNTFGGNTVL